MGNDEIKKMVGHHAKENGEQLELRMTELVQRLLREQEDRMKGHEDLRY